MVRHCARLSRGPIYRQRSRMISCAIETEKINRATVYDDGAGTRDERFILRTAIVNSQRSASTSCPPLFLLLRAPLPPRSLANSLDPSLSLSFFLPLSHGPIHTLSRPASYDRRHCSVGWNSGVSSPRARAKALLSPYSPSLLLRPLSVVTC